MLIRYNNLKIIINAQEAKVGGVLSASLAPYLYSANMLDFCKRFNEDTTIYTVGFPLIVNIKCDVVEKKYTYIIKVPGIFVFIKYYFKKFFTGFSIIHFYDFIVFLSELYNKDLYNVSRIFFGVLSSYKRRKRKLKFPVLFRRLKKRLNYKKIIFK